MPHNTATATPNPLAIANVPEGFVAYRVASMRVNTAKANAKSGATMTVKGTQFIDQNGEVLKATKNKAIILPMVPAVRTDGTPEEIAASQVAHDAAKANLETVGRTIVSRLKEGIILLPGKTRGAPTKANLDESGILALLGIVSSGPQDSPEATQTGEETPAQ